MSDKKMSGQVSNILLVQASPDMAVYLNRIDNVCFSEPWSEASFASTTADSSYYYCAAKDGINGCVIGYAGMYSVLDSADITGIAVFPQYRRRGIASELLSALITECVKRGVTELHLEVRESNTPARAMYEKNGFTVDGTRKNYYRHPTENAVLMTKRIEIQC